MKFEVYHAINPTFSTKREPEGGYELVARGSLTFAFKEQATDSQVLETAYLRTNTIEAPWFLRAEGFGMTDVKSPCRSTSVGDIVTVEGRVYVCDDAGWIRLENHRAFNFRGRKIILPD